MGRRKGGNGMQSQSAGLDPSSQADSVSPMREHALGGHFMIQRIERCIRTLVEDWLSLTTVSGLCRVEEGGG